MSNRLRDMMLYSVGSSTKQVPGGEPYSKSAGIQHMGVASEDRLKELESRFEAGLDLWTGEKL